MGLLARITRSAPTPVARFGLLLTAVALPCLVVFAWSSRPDWNYPPESERHMELRFQAEAERTEQARIRAGRLWAGKPACEPGDEACAIDRAVDEVGMGPALPPDIWASWSPATYSAAWGSKLSAAFRYGTFGKVALGALLLGLFLWILFDRTVLPVARWISKGDGAASR